MDGNGVSLDYASQGIPSSGIFSNLLHKLPGREANLGTALVRITECKLSTKV